MPWIRVVDEAEADGELGAIYDEVRAKRGRVASVFKVHSLHPATMKGHMALYLSIMFGTSPLTRGQREMIAVAVSAANRCAYCVTHHSEAMSVYVKDESVRKAVATDYRQAALSEKERAMLAYATKLTHESHAIAEADIEALRKEGWTDPEILDINLIASYFNFVNRVVSGLGLALEPEAERSYKY